MTRYVRREKGEETRTIEFSPVWPRKGGEEDSTGSAEAEKADGGRFKPAREQAGRLGRTWPRDGRCGCPARLVACSHGTVRETHRGGGLTFSSCIMADSAGQPVQPEAAPRTQALKPSGSVCCLTGASSFHMIRSALGSLETGREAAPRDASARVMVACHPQKGPSQPERATDMAAGMAGPGAVRDIDAWGHPPASCQVCHRSQRLGRILASRLCVARRLAAHRTGEWASDRLWRGTGWLGLLEKVKPRRIGGQGDRRRRGRSNYARFWVARGGGWI